MCEGSGPVWDCALSSVGTVRTMSTAVRAAVSPVCLMVGTRSESDSETSQYSGQNCSESSVFDRWSQFRVVQ